MVHVIARREIDEWKKMVADSVARNRPGQPFQVTEYSFGEIRVVTLGWELSPNIQEVFRHKIPAGMTIDFEARPRGA